MPKVKSQEVLLEDLLAAIFLEASSLRGTEELRFIGHDHLLQGVFWTLVSDHPWLDGHFLFDDSGFAPYSQALNEAIGDLQLGGLLGRENPEYQIAFMKPSAKRFYREKLKERIASSIDPSKIETVAKDLLRILEEDDLLKCKG